MSRLPDPGFDPRIADWLEADPDFAPPDVLRTVTSAIPSIPQRRALRLPWRSSPMPRFALLAAAALLTAAVGLGLVAVGSQLRPAPAVIPPPPSTPVSAAPSAAPTPTPKPSIDPTGDRILFEHFGNAPDGTEISSDIHPERRRLYLLDPDDAAGANGVEFLPDMPVNGKTSADVSDDGSSVVFMTWSGTARLWEANLDGTGLHQITPDDCSCTEWDPAYDPGGTRIVYGVARDGEAWLEIRDLATGETIALEGTRGPDDQPVPESPDWSPDGTQVVFTRTDWNDTPITTGMVHYGTEPLSSTLSIVDVAAGEVTDVHVPDLLPGDPHFSPAGTRILFTDRPLTKRGDESSGSFTIGLDGSDLVEITPAVNSATWLPDGSAILVQQNDLRLFDPDGTNQRLLPGTTDMTETAVGFVYVSHWVPAAP